MRTSSIFAAATALACLGCDTGPAAPQLDLPLRAADAPGGRTLAEVLAPLPLTEREARIEREVAGGNVPSWLRELQPVRRGLTVDGKMREALFWVTPDYLAVGADDDYLYVPLSPGAAQRIADRLGAALPTPSMVDAIWLAAQVRLAPQRLSPQDSVQSVRSVDFFDRHTSVIGGQRMLKGVAPDAFVAGHKKDLVLSTVLADDPGKVAVYGMHQPDGTPTQELSTVADARYVYYNHGVRLVHRRVVVDGVETDLAGVLTNPELAPVLSGEGALVEARYPTSETAPLTPPS